MSTTSSNEEDRRLRLAALNERTGAASLRGAWNRGERDAQAEARPWIWRWNDVLPLLLEAGELVPIDDRMRMRTIGLVNPSRRGPEGTTRTITATMQHLGPGEITEAHRHTRTSLYFMVHGNNTFTTAEGEQQWMEPGDLLVQPSWTWHGTQNRGSEPAIWLTIQDTGLINTFDAELRESYPDGDLQPVTRPEGYHLRRLGLFQTSAKLDTEGAAFPVKYPWKETLATLEALAEAEENDPYDGVVVEYRNPLTGGPATLTMACRIQMLQPGEETRSHRHTGNTIYLGVRGSGMARIGRAGPAAGLRLEATGLQGNGGVGRAGPAAGVGLEVAAVQGRGGDGEETLEWGERDCFYIPPWRWHSFRNVSSAEPLVLFSVSDHPLLEATRLYREDRG